MPLRSLYLDVSLAFESRGPEVESGLSPFFETLLRRCALTLESLVWLFHFWKADQPQISFGANPISFPRLKLLKLDRRADISPCALSALLNAPLRQLFLGPAPSTEAKKSLFISLSPLRNLDELVIPISPFGDFDAYVAFLEKHPRLRKLCIDPCSSELLDSGIIPLLSAGKFSNLRSLSLSWYEPSSDDAFDNSAVVRVAKESLAAIGTILPLEQLRLSTRTDGWRRRWLIDHDEMRSCLVALSNLKKLAICGDTYDTDGSLHVVGYYSVRTVSDSERRDAEARPELDEDADSRNCDADDEDSDGASEYGRRSDEIWERAHRNRMLEQAEKYATTLPSLEWMYCGQRPMEIIDPFPGVSKFAVPLTEERDECFTFFENLFAMGPHD
jgi:hypothetical protein